MLSIIEHLLCIQQEAEWDISNNLFNSLTVVWNKFCFIKIKEEPKDQKVKLFDQDPSEEILLKFMLKNLKI